MSDTQTAESALDAYIDSVVRCGHCAHFQRNSLFGGVCAREKRFVMTVRLDSSCEYFDFADPNEARRMKRLQKAWVETIEEDEDGTG